MNSPILHIDFNSYFATVEQQANPRLRGKPIGVTGGDRIVRTVLGAASIEAKRFGVKTGMQVWQARQLCPGLILVPGDSDKYLSVTKRFLNILKDYSPHLEVFSIDECFLKLSSQPNNYHHAVTIAQEVKKRLKAEIGEWISCSIGISYNKIMAKLAGSLYKPDGLVVIEDTQAAQWVLDRVNLDEICGIGPRIKKSLTNMGITNFKALRQASKRALNLNFKSYGDFLWNISRGLDFSPIINFHERPEVKSIGHRHTLQADTDNPRQIKQVLLKLTELVARRLRSKSLIGKTIHFWFRNSTDFHFSSQGFTGGGMQKTLQIPTNDGLEIFKASWQIFNLLWQGQAVRMVGVSVSNLKPSIPQNLSLLQEDLRKDKIIQALDKINNRYGEFTLQRGVLLESEAIKRKPNPFLSDRRFKV